MQKNRKNSNCAGASMPLVVCVAAFLVAFALALVYTAGLLLSRVNAKTDQERCYQLAESFAKQLEEELKMPAPALPGATATSFQQFANKFINESAYNEYDPEHPESTVYHYLAEPDADAPEYGRISVLLHKEIDESESTVYSGDLPDAPDGSNYTEIVKTQKEKKFQNHIFTVEVVANLDNLSYTYTTEYVRVDQYAVEFTHNGNVIAWNETDNKWCLSNEAGEEYDGWKNSAERIHYRYLTDKLVTYSYENVQP